MLATGSSSGAGQPTVTVTISTIERDGSASDSRTATLTLVRANGPQLLRGDLPMNLHAETLVIRLEASDPAGNPAPKIHSVRVGYKERAVAPRHG